MEILTSQLPSGGYGYSFPSVSVSPMTFMEICNYLENVPSDPLDKYLYDINVLCNEDRKIMDCYVMDVDFLIFYKKLCTISGDLTYNLSVTCPDCGKKIEKKISLDKDIIIELGGEKFETYVPKVKDFLKVFEKYLTYRKVEDLGMIKTIALIKEFNENKANLVEQKVLGATHEDITLLLALRDLYYDRVENINIICPECSKKQERRKLVAVSVDSLIVDFFRDLCNNSPIDATKVLFKQVS